MAFGADVANLIVQLKLDDSGFTGKLNNAARTLGRMDQGLSRMGRGAGQVGAGLARLGTVAAAAAAGGLAAVVTTAASFEQAFTGVEKTVEGTEAQLAELEETVRAMARTIPVSFEELAAIGEAGGALGVARDSLDEFIDVVARLSVSTDLSADAAATALGQLGTTLGLTGSDFEDFADSLVALGNAGASTESQIVEIAARFAAAGNSAGLTKEEILALASATASMGIEVEAAGSSLSRIFNSVATNIGTSSEKAVVFADTLGLSAKEFRRAWEEDALGTFQDFLAELAKLDQFEQANVLKGIGITGVRDVNAVKLMTQNLGFFGDQLEISRNATGELDKESQKFFDTTQGQWIILKNNVRDVAATIGAELLPQVNELIKEFVDFVQLDTTQAGIKDFAQDLASGIRGFVSELKGTDFSGLLSGLQVASSAAKVAFDAFRSLPGPLQGAIIGAIALNKVSGGGIGMLVKGIANIAFGGLQGGIAGIFGGRGTTPANPLFVSAIGGGLGGPGGAAGAAAKGGWLAAAGRVFGFAAAGVIGFEVGQFIGKEFFYNPTVQPTVEIERSQFDQFVDRNSSDREALESGLRNIEGALNNPAFNGPLERILLGDQIKVLEDQRAVLQEILRGLPGGVAPLNPTGGSAGIVQKPVPIPERESEAVRGGRAKPLTADEVIEILKRTSEFGLKGIGTEIEQGMKLGLDPFGQVALGLFRRAANPKAPEVLFEIKNHIIAAEEVQAAYLASGEINSAIQTQKTIDGLHALIGTHDTNNAILKSTIDQQREAIASRLDRALGFDATQSERLNTVAQRVQEAKDKIGLSNDRLTQIIAKDWSPTVNLSQTVNVNASLSASQASAAITISNIIRATGSGPGGPAPVGAI